MRQRSLRHGHFTVQMEFERFGCEKLPETKSRDGCHWKRVTPLFWLSIFITFFDSFSQWKFIIDRKWENSVLWFTIALVFQRLIVIDFNASSFFEFESRTSRMSNKQENEEKLKISMNFLRFSVSLIWAKSWFSSTRIARNRQSHRQLNSIARSCSRCSRVKNATWMTIRKVITPGSKLRLNKNQLFESKQALFNLRHIFLDRKGVVLKLEVWSEFVQE